MKNKGLKKFLAVFLSAAMSLSVYVTPVFAETTEVAEENGNIVSASASNQVTWSIDDKGVLYIEGSGDYQLNKYGDPDWSLESDKIKKAVVTTTGMKSMKKMFSGCDQLTSVDLSNFDASNVTDMSGMFENCSSLKEIKWNSSFDASQVKNMSNMFVGCTQITNVDLSNFTTANITNMSSMFSGCSNLKEVKFGANFDTSKVTTMVNMFGKCNDLTSVDLTHFNTGNVTDMSNMFAFCKNLVKLDLSSFKTNNVTDMSMMFARCDNLTELKWDVNKFDTSKVTNMQMMFNGDGKLKELDLTHFNTGNVTNMQWLFGACTNLKKLDLGNFNMNKVTSVQSMFNGCDNMTELTMPANLKCDVDFPTGTWNDTSGAVCKKPTKGLSTSMTYTKVSNSNPVDPTPVDPTPVDPTPVNPTPVDPTPVNPTPVNPTPSNPTSDNNNGNSNTSVKEGTEFASYQGYRFYQDGNGKIRCYDANDNLVKNNFKCDGTYTYYFQNDATAMTDRLTYHPDGVHIIYFDESGHEVFNNFTHVKKSISGDAVDDLCFFDVYGHMYVDVITYDQSGTKLYYANEYGVMERNGWFGFSKKQDGGIGYANEDGSLRTNQFSQDQQGRLVYFQGDGKLARGLISDGIYYYDMDVTDGHCLGQFPVQ